MVEGTARINDIHGLLLEVFSSSFFDFVEALLFFSLPFRSCVLSIATILYVY